MSWFAVVRERGSAWDKSRSLREQAGWDEHAAFMDALVEDGFVRLGGPLEASGRVLLIVSAETEADVRTRLSQDPWPAEMLRTASVEPWEILLGRP